jgi:hypothetical protein
VVSADPTADRPWLLAETGDLAPDGSVVVARRGGAGGLPNAPSVGLRLKVHTTGSLDEVMIKHPKYAGLGPVAWLDDDRFTTWGSANAHDVDLLTCSVRAQECSVTQPGIATLRADGSDPGFRLPNGQLWSGVRG